MLFKHYIMLDFLHIMVLHHVLIIRTSRCQKHYEHLEITSCFSIAKTLIHKHCSLSCLCLEREFIPFASIWAILLRTALKKHLRTKILHLFSSVHVHKTKLNSSMLIIDTSNEVTFALTCLLTDSCLKMVFSSDFDVLHKFNCIVNSFITINIISKQLNTHLHHGIYS